MGRQTLAELKQANEQAEKAKAAEAESQDTEDPELEVQDPTETELDADAEQPEPPAADLDDGEVSEGGEAELEPWQLSGDEAPSEGTSKTVPVEALIGTRRKLRGQLKESESEIDQLKKQIEALKAGGQQQLQQPAEQQPASQTRQMPGMPARPQKEDYYSHADPEAAFQDDLTKWHIANMLAEQQVNSQKARQQQIQQEALQQVEDDINQHYQGAAKLVQKAKIAEETYQAADRTVRSAFEAVRPQEGDLIVDQLISMVRQSGVEGTEMLFYNLGVNPARLQKLVSLVQRDNSGALATAYLGNLAAQITTKRQHGSSAPKPAKRISDGGSVGSASARKLKKQYDEAHKKGDVQQALNAKKAARAAGVDVSIW